MVSRRKSDSYDVSTSVLPADVTPTGNMISSVMNGPILRTSDGKKIRSNPNPPLLMLSILPPYVTKFSFISSEGTVIVELFFAVSFFYRCWHFKLFESPIFCYSFFARKHKRKDVIGMFISSLHLFSTKILSKTKLIFIVLLICSQILLLQLFPSLIMFVQ